MDQNTSCLRDFQVSIKLGEGAFGQVYKVKRKADGKQYALKKIKIGTLKEKERENALNEVRILASYDGQYIIGYKDSFYDEVSNTLCIVMEFASGGDLLKKIQQHLKSRTRFKEEQIWTALVHMTKGLKSLHQKKILHRDLKCANVFINGDGIYKLGDLNVSKVLKKDLAQTQTGTPYYASPQVWKDKPYGVKSDMWSLGCVLYEMAALKPPFTATDLQGLYKKVCIGHFERIPAIYSNDLAEVITSLLKVEPNIRPDTEKLLSNPLVHKHFKGDIGNPVDKMQECDQLLKTIKYNPRDLKGLKKILPKSNYQENRQIQSCKNSRKTPTQKVSNQITPIINENKLTQFLQKRKKVQQQERQRTIKILNEEKDQLVKQRERVLSACGVRQPYYCNSPRIAVHNKNDDNTNRNGMIPKKQDQQPKLPPKPQGIGQGINYKLPPRPNGNPNGIKNEVSNYNSQKRIEETRDKSYSKQNLIRAGQNILNSNRPDSSSSRQNIPRSSSVNKVAYPSWWG